MSPGKTGLGSEADKERSKELRRRKLVTEDSSSGNKVTFKIIEAKDREKNTNFE